MKNLTNKILAYITISSLALTSGCHKDFFAKCRVLKRLDTGIDNYHSQEYYDAQIDELKLRFGKLYQSPNFSAKPLALKQK